MCAYAPTRLRLPPQRSPAAYYLRTLLPPRISRLLHGIVQFMKKPAKAVGKDPMMGFRARPALRASIVRWAETQPDSPSLPEAVRRLVEAGLTTTSRPRHARSAKAQEANEMASRQL